MTDNQPDEIGRNDDPYYDLPGAEGRPAGQPVEAGSGPSGPESDPPRDHPPLETPEKEFDLGRWIREGWDLIRDELPGYIITGLIFSAAIAITANIHGIVYLAVMGPITAGVFLMTLNHMRGGDNPLIGDIFQAFQRYVSITLAHLILSMFLAIGFVLCFVPGLILWGMYLFTFIFIVDRGYDFWEAMEASRQLTSANYLEFTLFALVLIVLNVGGFLCFGVGLLVTLPLTFASVSCAYRDLVGLSPEPAVTTPPPVRHTPAPPNPAPPEPPSIIS